MVTIASTTDTQPDEEHAFYPSTVHLRGVEMMEEEPTKIDYFTKQIP